MKTVVLFFMFFVSLSVFSQSTTPQVEIGGVGIFPNPFNEKLFIQAENHLNKVEIYDEQFKKVLTVNQSNIIEASELQNGVYILKLYFVDQIVVRKVIKK
jgi:carbohydrate-selective porin OprB